MLVFFESVLVCISEYVFLFGGSQYYTYDLNHWLVRLQPNLIIFQLINKNELIHSMNKVKV